MKGRLLALIIMVLLTIPMMGQWATNGTNINNTNTGFVGIGNGSPIFLLHVQKSMTEPAIAVQNLGGTGGATFSMIDNASGADWKFKATLYGGFKIRDHAYSLDVIVIEPNTFANAFYVKNTGSIGIGTSSAFSALMDLNSISKGFLPPRMTYAEMNTIQNPENGLMVFCTDCPSEGVGRIALYFGEDWHSLSVIDCTIPPSAPTAGTHVPTQTQIVWNWNTVSGATGYKWNTTNDYCTAIDMGTNISKAETGLTCQTSYTRYVWANNACGSSSAVTFTASTSSCWVCGNVLTINHVAGPVAPVSKAVNYNTVTNVPGEPTKCWITRNLGADQQATSKTDATEASAGWYWQFNRMQGYKHDGTTRTPNSTWISSIDESSNWVSTNDPCILALSDGWRLATSSEWSNVKTTGGWSNWNGPYNSILKLHTSGILYVDDGSLSGRGVFGFYWSSNQTDNTHGWNLYFDYGSCWYPLQFKANGAPVRCINPLDQ